MPHLQKTAGLADVFSEVTYKTTPFEFLTSVRIEKAKSLLEQTDLPIYDVSIEVGYTFPGNFIKRFNSTLSNLDL